MWILGKTKIPHWVIRGCPLSPKSMERTSKGQYWTRWEDLDLCLDISQGATLQGGDSLWQRTPHWTGPTSLGRCPTNGYNHSLVLATICLCLLLPLCSKCLILQAKIYLQVVHLGFLSDHAVAVYFGLFSRGTKCNQRPLIAFLIYQ